MQVSGTSRQTKSSNGRVVNMFKPKQKRATLIKESFYRRKDVKRTNARTREGLQAKNY
jgi:hypothetical protein